MTLEGAIVAQLQQQADDLRAEMAALQARIHRLESGLEALHDYVTPRSVSPC